MRHLAHVSASLLVEADTVHEQDPCAYVTLHLSRCPPTVQPVSMIAVKE